MPTGVYDRKKARPHPKNCQCAVCKRKRGEPVPHKENCQCTLCMQKRGEDSTKYHKEDCQCFICREKRGERVGWSKGLTKETDGRVAESAKNIKKAWDSGKYDIDNRSRKMLESRKEVFGVETISESYEGKNNPFYGKHHTDEARKAISEASLEHWSDPNYIQKMLEFRGSVKGEARMSRGQRKRRLREVVEGESYICTLCSGLQKRMVTHGTHSRKGSWHHNFAFSNIDAIRYLLDKFPKG